MTASPRRRIIWYSVFGIIMLGGIGAMVSQEPSAAADPVKQQEHAEFLQALQLARDVRAQLKNPKSFELSRATVHRGKGVCLTYRATNSFNAVVPGQAVQPTGSNVYFMSDEGGPKFKAAWQNTCSAAGRDETRMVTRFLDG